MGFWDFFLNEFTVDEVMHAYGWYHFMWIGIMIVMTIASCLLFARKHDKKTDDIFIFVCGVVLILIEVFKQTLLIVDDGFDPMHFPFQFCDVPMYLAVIAPLVKNKKIKEAMYKFLAFVGLAAGLAVMAYPESCLNTKFIAIMIHTMLWHSTMVVMGIYLIASRRYMSDIKDFAKDVIPAGIMLYILIAIALIADIICHACGVTINLFYISPYGKTTFPILDIIQENAHYLVFLLSYIFAFSAGICIVWFVGFGIRKLASLKKSAVKK